MRAIWMRAMMGIEDYARPRRKSGAAAHGRLARDAAAVCVDAIAGGASATRRVDAAG